MAKLMVDYDGLAQNKNDIIKQKEQFDETVKALENIITDIQNNWVGQAADAYAEQFQSLKSDGLAKVDELLQTISDQLQSICDGSNEFDSNMAGQIRQ